MLNTTFFFDLAKTHFAFLESDYGYSLFKESPGIIEWRSPVAKARVLFDGLQTFFEVGPLTNPPGTRIWYDLGHIINCKERRRAFIYLGDLPPKLTIERDLKRMAPLVRTYCDEMLRGDFSFLPTLDAWLLTDAWRKE